MAMDRDDFETWVSEHLSEAIEDLQDVPRSTKGWIVAFANVLTRIARDEEAVEEEPSSSADDDDDDLDPLEDDDEDDE